MSITTTKVFAEKFGDFKQNIYLCNANCDGEIAQLVRASDS